MVHPDYFIAVVAYFLFLFLVSKIPILFRFLGNVSCSYWHARTLRRQYRRPPTGSHHADAARSLAKASTRKSDDLLM